MPNILTFGLGRENINYHRAEDLVIDNSNIQISTSNNIFDLTLQKEENSINIKNSNNLKIENQQNNFTI